MKFCVAEQVRGADHLAMVVTLEGDAEFAAESTEITSFLDCVWHSEGGNGNGPDLSRVVRDSRNNVRDALMTLEVELMAL